MFRTHPGGMPRRTFLSRAGGAALALGPSVSTLRTAPASSHTFNIDPDKKIRIGVVGGGFGASFQWHLHPNCIVHAVSDLRADRRDKLMTTYKCDRSYESLEKLILDKAIDAVAVFTGVPDHARHCIWVMNAGKHVICAVPVCITLEEAEKLIEAKEKTGMTYMMAETTSYYAGTLAAKQLYQEGRFGEIFYTEIEYHHPLDKGRDVFWYYQNQRTWRYGYAPMLYPTHSTAFVVGVTGERLTEVSCQGWCRPDLAYAYGKGKNQYDNPFTDQIALFKTNQGHVVRNAQFTNGTAHGVRAEWYGTKLTCYMPGSGGQPFRLQGEAAPDWREAPSFQHLLPEPLRVATGHGGSHAFLTHEFISSLTEKRKPWIDLYEALAMTVPGIIAQKSSVQGGELLKVPSFMKV